VDADGRGSVFLEWVVGMVEHKVGWVLGDGKSAAEVGGDEMWAGDERAPCLGNAPEFDDRLHGQS
jgi:hypothetical protein